MCGTNHKRVRYLGDQCADDHTHTPRSLCATCKPVSHASSSAAGTPGRGTQQTIARAQTQWCTLTHSLIRSTSDSLDQPHAPPCTPASRHRHRGSAPAPAPDRPHVAPYVHPMHHSAAPEHTSRHSTPRDIRGAMLWDRIDSTAPQRLSTGAAQAPRGVGVSA